MYTIIGSSLAIIFYLVNLYLLHKFSKGPVNIPDELPNFLISWLKEFEYWGSSQYTIQVFKKDCYIHISIYIVFLIVALLS